MKVSQTLALKQMSLRELQRRYFNETGNSYDRKLLVRYFRNHEKKIQRILQEIEPEPQKPARLLEVGAGTGLHIEWFLRRVDVQMVGIDLSYTMSEVARKRVAPFHNRVLLITCEAENLCFKREAFDAVFCVDTLHHVESPVRTLHEMLRVVKPEGKVIVVEPHAFFPTNLFYVVKPVEWGTFRMRKRQLIRWAEEAGWRNIRFERLDIFFPPFPPFCYPLYARLERIFKTLPIIRFFSTTTFLMGQKV